MTEKEALAIFNLEALDTEGVKDAYEMACFNMKNSLYKDPILPLMIDARIKKVKNFQEALAILVKDGSSTGEKQEIVLSELDTNEWLFFFHDYEQNKAVLRKRLANATSAPKIIEVMNLMKENELNYARTLVQMFNYNEVQEVKLSIQIPIIELIAELRRYLEHGIIDNSFESLKNLSHLKDNFKLGIEINRVKKMLNE